MILPLVCYLPTFIESNKPKSVNTNQYKYVCQFVSASCVFRVSCVIIIFYLTIFNMSVPKKRKDSELNVSSCSSREF